MSTPRTRGKRVNYAPSNDSDGENHDPQEPDSPPRVPVAKKRRSQAHEDADDDGEYAVEKPTMKKRRRSSRRSAHRLDGIMTLPVDIFAEVCQYLKPIDLLQLARASHRLREILVSAEAKSIWRTSRSLIEGLPDCPIDLTEPEYAALIFEIGCQGPCCYAKTRKTYYKLRLRMCARCIDARLYSEADLDAFWPGIPQVIFDNLPGVYFDAPRNCLMYLASVVNHLHASLVNERGECAFVEDETIINLHTYAMMLEETGESMEAWKIAQSEANQERAEELSTQRENAIIERLKAEGWEDGDMPIIDPRWQALAHRPAVLTERIWRRIHPELTELLQYSREERLLFEKYERRSQREDRFIDWYVAYVSALMETEPERYWAELPGRDIMSCIPSVMVALEEDKADFTEEMWTRVVQDVRSAVESNRLEIKRELCAIVSPTRAFGDIPTADAELNLVTSVFACGQCRQLLWYDEVMVHSCCVKYRWIDQPNRLRLSGKLFGMDALLSVSQEDQTLIRRVVRDLGMQRVPTLREAEVLGECCICRYCEVHHSDLEVEPRSFDHVIRHILLRHDWLVRRVYQEETDTSAEFDRKPVVRLLAP